MGSRQRAVMSPSLPPDTTKEKKIAKTEGKRKVRRLAVFFAICFPFTNGKSLNIEDAGN